MQEQHASFSKSSCPAAGSSTVFEDARNAGTCEQLPQDMAGGWTKSLQFFPGVTAVVCMGDGGGGGSSLANLESQVRRT